MPRPRGTILKQDRLHRHCYKVAGSWMVWDANMQRALCIKHRRRQSRCTPCSRLQCDVHTQICKECPQCRTPRDDSVMTVLCIHHKANCRTCKECHIVVCTDRKELVVNVCSWHKAITRLCRRCKANVGPPCLFHTNVITNCNNCTQ